MLQNQPSSNDTIRSVTMYLLFAQSVYSSRNFFYEKKEEYIQNVRIFFSDGYEHKVRILWRREVNHEVNSSERSVKSNNRCGGLLEDVTTVTRDERKKEN